MCRACFTMVATCTHHQLRVTRMRMIVTSCCGVIVIHVQGSLHHGGHLHAPRIEGSKDENDCYKLLRSNCAPCPGLTSPWWPPARTHTHGHARTQRTHARTHTGTLAHTHFVAWANQTSRELRYDEEAEMRVGAKVSKCMSRTWCKRQCGMHLLTLAPTLSSASS
jgi:hypothetical protein